MLIVSTLVRVLHEERVTSYTNKGTHTQNHWERSSGNSPDRLLADASQMRGERNDSRSAKPSDYSRRWRRGPRLCPSPRVCRSRRPISAFPRRYRQFAAVDKSFH